MITLTILLMAIVIVAAIFVGVLGIVIVPLADIALAAFVIWLVAGFIRFLGRLFGGKKPKNEVK